MSYQQNRTDVVTPLKGPTELKKIYDMGALSGTQTIIHYDIGGSPHIPVEVTITDQAQAGKGAFWTADVDRVLFDAWQNGDTAQSNPNLPVLQAIFREMVECREMLGHPPHQSKFQTLPEEIEALFARTAP